MKYRKEIDGLRALAVLPVIFFHVGFESFSGGYVGVDIFFVISGYLITTILINGINEGNFSIITFYERRARRILPALFLVMLVTVPLAWLFLAPSDYIDFSESLIAVSFFVSNILFWKESGYFEAAIETKPLIHTWSLAVEEQFYLFFPLILMAFWKDRKKSFLIIFVVLLILSLLTTLVSPKYFSNFGFYFLPARFWEIAFGSVVALIFYRYKTNEVKLMSKNRWMSEFLSFIGFNLVVISIFILDKDTPFPSAYTLLPVLGTALIILFASGRSFIGRLLSLRPLVFIGLISYSAYLWHQPIVAFLKYRNLELTSFQQFSVIISSLILAYYSWKFIEAPFRMKGVFGRKFIFTFSLFGMLLLTIIGAIGLKGDGFPGRFHLDSKLLESFQRSLPRSGCFDKTNLHIDDEWYCVIGSDKVEPSFVVFGDSHVLSLHDSFNIGAKNNSRSGFFIGASGCIPFLGVHSLRSDQETRNCYLLNKRVRKLITDHGIKSVFLIARWTYYTDGSYSGKDMSYLGLKVNDIKSKLNSRKAFVNGYNKTISSYKGSNVKLHMISQVPEQKKHPKKIYLENARLEKSNLLKISVSKKEHIKLNQYVNSIFYKSYYPKIIDFTNDLCNTEGCIVGNLKTSFYFDEDHLSKDGAHRLLPKIESLLRK